jgi:hypothetical protein
MVDLFVCPSCRKELLFREHYLWSCDCGAANISHVVTKQNLTRNAGIVIYLVLT